MGTKVMYIKDITATTDSWEVKVIVEEKTQPRQSFSGSVQYQRMVLADETGQKVVATIFGSDIDHLKDSFSLYNTYTISNAKVKRCDPRYDKFNYPYQWTINKKTAHNSETKICISQSVLKLKFASLTNLKDFIGTDTLLDVLAIVIDKKEQRSFTADEKDYVLKEYAIINQEKQVVVLTLWNAVAKSDGCLIDDACDSLPVIRVSNLSVSAHYGGSIGSTPSTVVVVDPPIPEAQNLKTWRSNNLKVIVENTMKDHFIHTESTDSFPRDNIFSIADVLSDEKVEKFTVKVNAKITDLDQKYFYMACGKCYSGVNAEFKYKYTCVACKRPTEAAPREKIHLNVSDASGCLDVTIFGPQVVKILQMDSVMCMELYNAGQFPSVNCLNERLSCGEFFMKVIKRKRHISGMEQYVYVVGHLERVEDISKYEGVKTSEQHETGLPQCQQSIKPPVIRTLFQEDTGQCSVNEDGHGGTSQDSST